MKYISCKDIQSIGRVLSAYRPKLIKRDNYRQASVALVCRQTDLEPEILFIQRARSDNDPWSGQIAFPGGGVELDDNSLEQAAIRESREEINLLLDSKSSLGRLDDLQGRNNNREIDLIISCFVFYVVQQHKLSPNYEVAEAFWVPISVLANKSNHFDFQTGYRAEPYPAIQLGPGNQGQDRVLWGLTYRFIRCFLDQVCQ